jgi:hypothetical protein
MIQFDIGEKQSISHGNLPFLSHVSCLLEIMEVRRQLYLTTLHSEMKNFGQF